MRELLVADSERRILRAPGGIARLVPREVLSTGNLRGIKMAPFGAIFMQQALLLMRITGVSPTVTLPDSLISSLISSMLEITTGVRVDLAFSSSSGEIKFDNRIADFHALTFFSDTLEAFAFQFNGINTEVNEQLDAAIRFNRERVVGFEKFYQWYRLPARPFCCQSV